jgi:putative FmdB family regulatory protein
MPTYQYVCSKCDHEFEKFQPITEQALSVCPKDSCAMDKWGKGRVKRVIGAGAGLIFKGTGFYITDYRSEKYKEAAKKESTAASSTGGESKAAGGGGKGGATKAESKPAKPAKSTSGT